MAPESFDIKIKIIKLPPPTLLHVTSQKDHFPLNNEILPDVIAHERFLRKTAYKNTTLKIDTSFFDDTDMQSEYFLAIVFCKQSNTPLLSSRHYFDKAIIKQCLQGDKSSGHSTIYFDEKFNIDDYKEGELFLADRLSGNRNNSTYRHNRDKIFSLYYSTILNTNKNCNLILMVRDERHNKQLAKYLQLGFVLIGETSHKSITHHIILADLKKLNLNAG